MMVKQANLPVLEDRKGIVLAGKSGRRFYPLTLSTPKQLLPINKVPMIFYPISILMLSGIRDILIITAPDEQLLFQKLLGDGKQYGVTFDYAVQTHPDGIAQSLLIASELGFINNTTCSALILGDNLFFGEGFISKLRNAMVYNKGATIFACSVEVPEEYGVIEFSKNSEVVSIEEKPLKAKSKYVSTGIYLYDEKVVDLVQSLKPSMRGELEITDLNNIYLGLGLLNVEVLEKRDIWFDNKDLYYWKKAEKYVNITETQHETFLACLESVAFKMGFINEAQFGKIVLSYQGTEYGRYLLQCRTRYVSNEKYIYNTGLVGYPFYDAFIAHATEDKEEIVRALSEELTELGFKIWYDETELKLGDSLRESIDHGLKKSRFGIVVLSPNFFSKDWPKYELNSLVAREMQEGKVLIPIHYKVSLKEVLNYSPSLADRFALRIDNNANLKKVAEEIGDALNIRGRPR